jgi:hypothetical protein
MQIILILFFASLAGIAVMIGRKLMMIQSGQIETREKISLEIPDSQKIKHAAIRNAKKYGYMALVGTLRTYIRSTNFLKQKGAELKDRVKNKINVYFPNKHTEKVERKEGEVSSFLKTVSEYKHKIKHIKHQIKKEEGIE